MNKQQDLAEYVDRLYSAAVKKTGDTHAAEDIVQETFLAALKALSRGKEPENLWRWLLRILSNKYADWLRDKYNKPCISFEDYPFDISDEGDMDDDTAEKLEVIRRELGYLGRIHREVMTRFYMRDDPIKKIASDLGVSEGTVKSRLNTGRQYVKKGAKHMENYAKQSYEPDTLWISCSGDTGLDDEPFSLVGREDKLAQNILLLAYPKPVTEVELAKSLGVPAPFVEPIVGKLIDGELMRRTDGGKVYTDFIIYTDRDRKATMKKQLETANKHFDRFWNTAANALAELRKKEYYKRQPEEARAKLELHFCAKLLANATLTVRDEVTGHMPYSEYPYRKNGGRWFAMGQHYPADHDPKSIEVFRKYGIDGEVSCTVKNFRDTKSLALRIYSTHLGRFPSQYSLKAYKEYAKWLYELYTNVPEEGSAVGNSMLGTAGELIDSGILKKEGTLKVNIPVLTTVEFGDYCALYSRYVEILASEIRDVLLPAFEGGYVNLPPHLTSVPKWQQYIFCGHCVPMAVIHKAREKGIFLAGAEYPLPATILIYEKA